MVTRRDYRAEAVFAAKSVLIELAHLLGEYRDGDDRLGRGRRGVPYEHRRPL